MLQTARRFVPRIVLPIVIRVLPRISGGSRFFEYLGQLRIHYWMDDEARHRAGGKRGRIVGRRLPWTGQNFESLKAGQWMAHVYGDIDAARLEALRNELDVEVLTFPACPRKRLNGGKAYLVRPDGFVVAEAFADQAATAFTTAVRAHLGVAQ